MFPPCWPGTSAVAGWPTMLQPHLLTPDSWLVRLKATSPTYTKCVMFHLPPAALLFVWDITFPACCFSTLAHCIQIYMENTEIWNLYFIVSVLRVLFGQFYCKRHVLGFRSSFSTSKSVFIHADISRESILVAWNIISSKVIPVITVCLEHFLKLK